MVVEKIISGGQTGADRGGLDAAVTLGIPHGGFCPRGRLAEDGRIPACYRLEETPEAAYAVRTERNVLAACGTVILSRGALTGGSGLTRTLAERHGRPHLHIDLERLSPEEASALLLAWCSEEDIRVLNVAGSRESGSPGMQQAATEVLLRAFGMS